MRVRDFWHYYIYAYTRRNWLSSPAHSHTHTDTRRHPQILTQLQSSLFVRWFELGGLIALIVLIARQSPVAAATKLDNCGSGDLKLRLNWVSAANWVPQKPPAQKSPQLCTHFPFYRVEIWAWAFLTLAKMRFSSFAREKPTTFRFSRCCETITKIFSSNTLKWFESVH